MNRGYGKIFWGLIFATFHINLNNLEIIPTFIGFIMVLIGINEINYDKKYDNLNKAGMFSTILIVASLIAFFDKLSYGGIFNSTVVNLLWITGFTICEILMIYNLLEGSAVMLGENNYHSEAEEYSGKVQTYIIAETVFLVVNNIGMVFVNGGLLTVAVVIALIVRIWILVLVRRLSNIYSN